MSVFPESQIRSGVDIVLEIAGFEQELHGADLVITGEGRLDMQTLSGKAVSGIVRSAARRGVPVAAIVGSAENGASELLSSGCSFRVVELVALAGSASEALSDPARYVEAAAAHVLHTHAPAKS